MKTKLPPRLNSEMLAKYSKAGEPMIVLKATMLGETAPYELADDNGKAYIFKWSSQHRAHVLKVPVGIWMQDNARMAHDLLDKARMPMPLVVLVEMPKVEAPKDEAPKEEEPEIPKVKEASEAGDSHTVPETGSTPVPASISPPQDGLTNNAAVADGSELMWQSFPLHQAIAEAVKEKPKRLSELKEMFEVDDETLKRAISCSASRAEIGHAGWVKLKA